MRIFIITLISLLLSLTLYAKGHATKYENPFSVIYGGAGTNIYGDYHSIASSVQCVKDGTGCDYSYSGYLFDAETKHVNSVTTSIIPLNSSTEDLILPSEIDGNDIVFAGLFWQANITGPDADDNVTGTAGRDQVNLIDPLGTLHTLTADKLWYHDMWGDGTGSDGGYRSFYQGYKDVTQIVQNSYSKSSANNNFTIGNIKSTDGSDYGTYFWGDETHAYNGVRIGFWANWNLIVVYKYQSNSSITPKPKPKNITLFAGFDALIPLGSGTVDEVTLDLDGFITPTIIPDGEEISAKLLFYGAAGEKKLHYDTFEIQNKKTAVMSDLYNDANPVDGAFNGSVSNMGVPIDNSISYYPGLDSDEYNISAYMDTAQTSTQLRLTAKNVGGTGDQIFPGLIAFSTDIYEPEFCYDYAYKQNNTYFTEDNDGSNNPKITGTVTKDQPVKVVIFLKNMVDSNFLIENMFVDILDINTSQLKYTSDSVERALSGELFPTSKVDGIAGWDLNVSNAYIKDIPIGDQVLNDYFYVYYTLNPEETDLDDALSVRIKYDLNVGSASPIEYILELGSDIPLCSTSNFNYTPTKGKFVVVDKGIYADSTKYNLPTQVTNREGYLQIISIDDDFSDSIDNLTNISTIVAVEMIDVGSFHYTDAACVEQDSAITDRVWLTFENNASSIDFSSGDTSAFYSKAKQSAAFRVTYNAADIDGNVIELETIGVDNYNLKNLPIYTDGKCNPQFGNTNEDIANYCSSNMTRAELNNCMECIYGLNTRFICSRDNFAIRPEAFALEFDDLNQTTGTSKTRIVDNISGVVSPSSTTTHLASGYNYNLNISAVNHKNATPSNGYTMTYNTIDTDRHIVYKWEPSTTLTGCNDTSDKNLINNTTSFKIVDGSIDLNTSVMQVGEYRLEMRDSAWTVVDSNPLYMSHHDNDSYLLPSTTLDCVANSSITIAENTQGMNGCDISSQHNASGGTLLKYRDYKIEFHPYKIDMTNVVLSYGENNQTVWPAKPFIYMADISTNEEQSIHLNGSIKVVGHDNGQLSNFVGSCFAKPINLLLNKSNTVNIPYQYRYHSYNATKSIEYTTGNVVDLNNTNIPIVVNANDFNSTLNGELNTVLNFNFFRDKTKAENPQTVTLNNYTASCVNTSDCTMNADLTSSFVSKQGLLTSVPITIEHYYGRTNAPRQRYQGNSGTGNIYFEVFCDSCDKTKLQTNSNFMNDPRWLINNAHTLDYGKAGNVSQKFSTKVTATVPTNTVPSTTSFNYLGTVYPYKATMQNLASPWLVYNKYNSLVNTNEFEIEFDTNTDLGWAGKADTNSTTKIPGLNKTNRRTMW